MLFKQFWESSSIPKLGEQDAQGFASFVDSQMVDTIPLEHMPVHMADQEKQSHQQTLDNTGWSGWFELGARSQLEDEDAEEEISEDVTSVDESNEDETEAQILKELEAQCFMFLLTSDAVGLA